MYQIDDIELAKTGKAYCSYSMVCGAIPKNTVRGINFTSYCGHETKRFFCPKHTRELLLIHRKHLNKLIRKLRSKL